MDKKPTGAQPEEFNLPKLEEKVLESWKSGKIFEKSLAQRQTKDKKKHFVFYEGPPTANGKPGIHHVLARSFKDVILRYKTMAGYYVPRKGGWDTHGLPVEIEVEKQLGLKSKKDIEKFGIAEFNKKCRESVWKYKEEWERLTERMGFWIDLKNPYITYTADYIESLWWIIAQIWKKKLLYKGHKVVPWCTRCGTALSSHELAQGYKETTDTSAFVKFKLKPGQKIGKDFVTDGKTYILSWTTTPWTLPGNVALAVGDEIEYEIAEVHRNKLETKEYFIFAVDLHEKITSQYQLSNPKNGSANEILSIRTLKKMRGKEFINLRYEPLFKIPALKKETAYKIYPADFVTTTDGTGVVHTAVMYGEDDYELGKKVGLPQHHTVTEEGRFAKDVPVGLAGLYVKSKQVEDKILDYLRSAFHLLRTEPYTHEYPFCWRCGTPVIYYARDSWFVAMSALRDKLLAVNKKINWVPAHVKEGRFGEWLREVKDWNFSRERFWGTPLPVWECTKCERKEVVGSVEELRAKSMPPRNRYWAMRHGEAQSNLRHLIDSGQEKNLHLTLKGRTEVERAVAQFKKELEKRGEKLQLLAYSSVTRTKETAGIVAKLIGLKKNQIVADQFIREIKLGVLSGCRDREYHAMFPSYASRFERGPEGGESLRDLRSRMWHFLQDCEKKYKGKNILIVSHEYPIWMMHHVALGWSEERAIDEKEKRDEESKEGFVPFAEIRPLELASLPRNESGEADLHKPYIDAVKFSCAACGGEMRRVKEVVDVWFDSGAMPFAQGHWPFAQTKNLKLKTEKLPTAYPADYIVEAVDQTRGWFYTLLAIGTLLDAGAPYKNAISLGHLNDKHGQKMSKSKGNIVDPWVMAEKYGMDAVRWYFFVATPPGEPKNFDENEIAKTFRKFHLIIWNSLKFFETYQAKSEVKSKKSKVENVLDVWILTRLDETIISVTTNLETYNVREAALAIESLVDDLSRWYIRRSRRRFQKPLSNADHYSASVTLDYVLRKLGKLVAPFAPFFAEAIYEGLGGKNSVHLEDWPTVMSKVKSKKSKVLIEQMAEVRRLATLALAKRAEAGIKVRQPLATLKVKSQISNLKSQKELLAILADEVNVKEVVVDPRLTGEVELDTAITPELRAEGTVREFTRLVQDLRQSAKLRPKDRIVLFAEVPEEIQSVLIGNEKMFIKEVGAEKIEYKKPSKFRAGASLKVGDADVWIGFKKA